MFGLKLTYGDYLLKIDNKPSLLLQIMALFCNGWVIEKIDKDFSDGTETFVSFSNADGEYHFLCLMYGFDYMKETSLDDIPF